MRYSLSGNAVLPWLAVEASAGGMSGGLLAAAVGQRIGAFVARIAGVAGHPAPFAVMQVAQRVEPLPQLGVLHRLLVGRLPAALLPAVDPLGDALAHVLAVGIQRHVAGALQ